MADRRRRRPKIANSDSECSEDEDVVVSKREQKLSGGEKSCTSNDGSDDDSATEDNEDETGEDETEAGTEYEEDDEEGQDKDGVKGERQSGDGQEQPESLDDDEDRKNPAYIPRRGAFYEHDTRISDDVDPKEAARAQKKLWVDKGKWGHDRFVDTFQAPKSTEEIIAEYGYDIRVYDTPPDAPPKSFGRGRRDRNQSNKLGDFIDMGAGGDGYHNNRGGYPPRQRGWRGGRGYGGDRGHYTYSEIRDGGDARNYQKQFSDKYDQDYPSRNSYNDDRLERNRGGYHDDRVERNHDDNHDNRSERNSGGYRDDKLVRNRGGYHTDGLDRNHGGFHDDRSERSRGTYHDDRPESNRGGYRDNRLDRNRRGSSQERYYDRGDGHEYDNRPSEPVTRGGRGGRGRVSTETPGEENRRSPQHNSRQWTNSTRGGGGGGARHSTGPTARGAARLSMQTERPSTQTQRPNTRAVRPNTQTVHPNMHASEYPPTTTAPPSRSSQDRCNVDRPTAEMSTANRSNETQDVRQSTAGRTTGTTHGCNQPSEPYSQSDRPRHNKAAVPPSIVPPTTISSTKRSHTSVTTSATKHDTHATTVPSGGTTQNRPKRYSSQRQRNAPEVVPCHDPVVTEPQPPSAPVQVVPAPRGVTSPPRPLRRPAPTYFQPVYATQPPTVFHPRADHSPPHTVASFPRQHPPHLLTYTLPGTNQMASTPQIYSAVPTAMGPPPVSMATAQPTPIMAPQYIAGTPAILNYVQQGQPAPYHLTTAPPGALQFPAPQQPQPQPQQPQPQQDAIHVRGGTVYFNPDVQQQLIPPRSPVRRVKVAIPIVNPEEVQSPALYIQMADSEQATYAPYYQLTTYEDSESFEYEESRNTPPEGTTRVDPECDSRTESTSGDEGTGDIVSGKSLELSEETVHDDDTMSVTDQSAEKDVERESSFTSVNESETIEVAVVQESVAAENDGSITENKKDSDRDITDVNVEGDVEESEDTCAQTDRGETDRGETDRGETDRGETDRGETDRGETDRGETDRGETDRGETDRGETDRGETRSQDNVRKTGEENTKSESFLLSADKVDDTNENIESDPVHEDTLDEEQRRSESDPHPVGVTNEEVDHEMDHVCEDHSYDGPASSDPEAASGESNSQDADEYEPAQSESEVVGTDKATLDIETNKTETDEHVADTTNPTQDTEAGVVDGTERDVTSLDDNKTSLVNLHGDVSTSVNESESMQIKTKPADVKDVSIDTETSRNKAAEDTELEASHADDADEVTEKFVDAEDGFDTSNSSVGEDNITEVVAPTAKNNITEELVTGGTPV